MLPTFIIPPPCIQTMWWISFGHMATKLTTGTILCQHYLCHDGSLVLPEDNAWKYFWDKINAKHDFPGKITTKHNFQTKIRAKHDFLTKNSAKNGLISIRSASLTCRLIPPIINFRKHLTYAPNHSNVA